MTRKLSNRKSRHVKPLDGASAVKLEPRLHQSLRTDLSYLSFAKFLKRLKPPSLSVKALVPTGSAPIPTGAI